jgi:hypothetical protein
VVLIWLTGCGPGKLDVSQTIDLGVGDAKAIELSAQPKPQTINVEFSSSAGEISVYLFKEADAKGEDGLIGSNPAKALEKKNGKSGSFSAEVPENTPTRVIFRGATAPTKVDVKINNKK